MPILTVRGVMAAKPRRDRTGVLTRTEVPDAACPGLYLVIQPSGTKTWAWRFHRGGKTGKKTLGPVDGVGALTLSAARAAAAVLRDRLENNSNRSNTPTAKSGAAQTTHGGDRIEVAAASFLELHVHRKTRASSACATEGIFNRIVLPAWRGRSIDSIRKRDVIDLVESVAASGYGYRANRTLAAVSKFFNWLVARDALALSPVTGVERPHKEEKRTRVLDDDELRRLWLACEHEGAAGQVIQLLVLAGVRRDEAGECVWSEIDDRRLWTLPPERTKNGREHVIPLSSQAWALIDARPRFPGCPFVFSIDGKGAPNNWDVVKCRISTRAEIPEKSWRLHDLRRTCASGMQKIGINVPIVEKALNHQSGVFRGIVSVYQTHEYADEVAVAFQRWGDRVAQIVGGKPAKIISLHGRQ